jgi:hypothetical protein
MFLFICLNVKCFAYFASFFLLLPSLKCCKNHFVVNTDPFVYGINGKHLFQEIFNFTAATAVNNTD